MHSYLRAIGFSELKKEPEMEKYLNEVFHDYTDREIARGSNNTAYMQMYKEYAPNMGIVICGTLDGNGFHRENYFPYLNGSRVTTKEDLEVERKVDGVSWAGVCDDGRIGVSLIFYLQNSAEYQRKELLNQIFQRKMTATLSGLSSGGVILFPVHKDHEQISHQKQTTAERSRLLNAAKNGDQDAMESLTIEDMDLYTMISRRMYLEDIYSIVDTFFMPYGVDCDQYQIMGNIQYFEKVTNTATDEEVYHMKLECNDIDLDVCVNKSDLMGEPEVGRRFKGNIWLQGKVNFE
ncbi:MAG: DUF3881 family protein [Lachnospiraceae bacterium]|nr:DUF3881 family protein [Lachnospiraceae bacterium]